MSSKNNIGRDSLILSITQFMTLGVNMVNAMLLSRFRTLGEYGTYSQVMMVCTIIITFFTAGFSQCINYFLGKSQTEEEKAQFIQNYYAIISLIGVVGGSVALVLLPLLKNYFGNELLSDFWFVLLLYPLSHILTSGADRFFIAYKKTTGLLAFKVGHSVIVLSEILVTLLLGLNFYQYMMIYTAVEVLFGLSVYLWIKLISGVTPIGFHGSLAGKILAFAIPMALASLVSTINTEMDKLIVGGLVDTETLAIYTNAAKELPIFIFSTSISSVVMPFVVKKVASEDFCGAAQLWKKSITLSYYIICFFVTVLFAFAPQIISLLYSDKYLPGINVFRVYSLVLLFRITYFGMMLNALGKTKTILKASIATMISNLVLDIVLYKALGLIGPAIATLLSVAIMNLYQLRLTKKLVCIRFTDIYPLKEILFITLVNLLLGGSFYLVQQLVFTISSADQILLSVIVGVFWLLAYFLIFRKKLLSLWRDLNRGDEEPTT